MVDVKGEDLEILTLTRLKPIFRKNIISRKIIDII